MKGGPFTCESCGAEFSVPPAALAKYPGWTPRTCLRCRDAARSAEHPPERAGPRADGGAAPGSAEQSPPGPPAGPAVQDDGAELERELAALLRRHRGGPAEGVFTDGACSGNPGPGGWGVVHVARGEIVGRRFGFDPQTTNNRMELTALIHGYQLLPADARVTIYSDSQLCVRTINEWAAGWQRRGWRRKSGPIKNLELVREAYALARAHPHAELRWIKAHDGSRWNEYVDRLATARLRYQKGE